MDALREYVARCRELALIARHPVVRVRLLEMADDLERAANLFERLRRVRMSAGGKVSRKVDARND